MKKFKLVVIMCLVMTFLLVGCGDKTALTSAGFTETMEGKEFRVADVSSDYADYDYIDSVTIAQSADGWQIEFYVLEDENYAQGMFNENKSFFESTKGNSSSESSVSVGNHSSYALTSGGVYMCVSRIDNTLIYTRVDSEYKNTVKDIVKELGY